MQLAEPGTIALFLLTAGSLVVIAVVSSQMTRRLALPFTLVFLLLGMLAGSEGVGGIVFTDYRLAFQFGTVALVLILFDGGLNTPMETVRRVLAPAGILATVGVAATAALVAVAARLGGFGWPQAALLGAVVSSTDAAAVFGVLRGGGLRLRPRIGTTLEIESGINDPAAIILTIAITTLLAAPEAHPAWMLPFDVVIQAAVGAIVGWGIGIVGRRGLAMLRLSSSGLYPAVTIGLAFISFGLATVLNGSGFLATYLAGLILGNGRLPYRPALTRVHDATAWLSQISMFLLFGLLVTPSDLPGVAVVGTLIAVALALVIRPLVVWLCLLPFHYNMVEIGFMGWVGLRGAVPIVLAIFPVLAGAPGAEHVFDAVFFLVVVNAIIPGSTVGWLARKLG
ncbi:MAG TPA: potassium/proton antiporter, partial [Gemmatimonadales bacterium]|nr:potassium/proton antiporter [Gemmatimonadales bacterium]